MVLIVVSAQTGVPSMNRLIRIGKSLERDVVQVDSLVKFSHLTECQVVFWIIALLRSGMAQGFDRTQHMNVHAGAITR